MSLLLLRNKNNKKQMHQNSDEMKFLENLHLGCIPERLGNLRPHEVLDEQLIFVKILHA